MDTALIIVIAVVAGLVLFAIARRAWARRIEARREKAGELRVESTREEERARRAEIEAGRKREAAEGARRRAERLDPDTETPGRRFSPFRRGRDEDDGEAVDRGAETETEERPGLFHRLLRR